MSESRSLLNRSSSIGPRLEFLLRDVNDESTPQDKALWIALTTLMDIDECRSHVNYVQHVAARALERMERALAGEEVGP